MFTSSKITTFLLVLLLAPLLYACGMGEEMPEGYENSKVSHAHKHWSQGAATQIPFLFVDVRTDSEWAEGHIQGAMHIPVGELEKRVLELPKDKQLYVYCHSGRRSVTASKILAKAGFTQVENVLGGISAWKDAGYPVVQ